MLKDWRDLDTWLYRITVANKNTDTVLLDKKRSKENLRARPNTVEAINNVYYLPWLKSQSNTCMQPWPFHQKTHGWRQSEQDAIALGWWWLSARSISSLQSQTRQRKDTRQTKKGIQLKIIKRAYQWSITNSTTTKGMGCDDQKLWNEGVDSGRKNWKFPTTSSRRAKYIMVMCEIDKNAFMKNRTQEGNDQSIPIVVAMT